MFSKACEYGIKATIYIAHQSLESNRVSLKGIAEEINSPEAFTAKILQQLVKNNIIDSVKGAMGGFQIDKDEISKIKLSQIVYAIDGNKVYTGCGLGLHTCNDKKPCPVHDNFISIRNDLKKMLETTSLLTMTKGLDVGLTYLKR
ncbi:RrF2 family transcriptional regulator [Cellulophaga tyrosinoxydans]|uniref:Transcriptional regulator, BadM/Rrf2 family n=1 Tax=Cellulophaga tyrosinoxydans TaxID=504486 RepID=A0A1W2A0M1_9FLAO|nr:Rrf2 family transcriptional regulator [Cellulophaga tyrosinoxydans]SMC54194.1 transcriptional regulator, BadM/Rrf2 family [Cellulophaga tyrosinoxydans]